MKTILITAFLSIPLCLAPLCGIAQEAEQEWIELFDGQTLEGWSKVGGDATYKVEDGMIIGTTGDDKSANTFLVHEREFSDFELEFDVKYPGDTFVNSGVQIRSKVHPDAKPSQQLDGPQVEIEKAPGQAGYIYGEKTTRDWLYPTKEQRRDGKLDSHSLFKNDEWNHYRVVAQGPRIQVWLNGEQIADVEDERHFKSHPGGVIGLQVHRIPRPERKSVAWKNIRIRPLD
jgi:hypothetical protein